MTREEEMKLVAVFVEKNGVTKLPPDTRGPDFIPFSAWKKTKKKQKRKKKQKSA